MKSIIFVSFILLPLISLGQRIKGVVLFEHGVDNVSPDIGAKIYAIKSTEISNVDLSSPPVFNEYSKITYNKKSLMTIVNSTGNYDLKLNSDGEYIILIMPNLFTFYVPQWKKIIFAKNDEIDFSVILKAK